MWPLGWLLAAACAAAAAGDGQCYWSCKDPYPYFSTVTPYDDVRGDIRDEPDIEGCEPVALWMLVRHGTRHPNEAAAALMRGAAALRDRVLRNHRHGRGEMCAQDIQDLEGWEWDSKLEEEPMYLTENGWRELEQLGARVAARFGALLRALGAGAARFRATDSQRTAQSALAFLQGLDNSNFTVEEPLDQDEVIRSYKFCDKYTQDSKNDTRFSEEEKIFHKTDDYQQILFHTRRRLGLPALSAQQAAGLYELCRYHRAFTAARRHAWCAAFRQQDLPVLEYKEDLEDHFARGYGSAYAARLGAMTLKHLLLELAAAVSGEGARVAGYFTHDTMLQMVLTALGLFRDHPAGGGFAVDPHRRWRTSLMTPFASNIIVVVHKCEVHQPGPGAVGTGGGGGGARAPEHRVQLFVNERLVPLGGARACEWHSFRDLLLPFANATMDFCQLSTD